MKLRRRHLSTDAHAIFEAPTRAEADARLAAFRTTWGGLEAEVVRLLTKDLDAYLTFYQFEQSRIGSSVQPTSWNASFASFAPNRTKSGPFPTT
jgi:transposase-like protein